MPIKISRILHAGFVFKCNETEIAFDPIFENPFSRNCYAFPSIYFDDEKIKSLKFDAIFISHFHDDHCSLESLNLLDRNTPIYMYCQFEEIFDILNQLGFKKVIPLKIDESVFVGPFEVTPRRALDSDVDSLFQIKAVGLNILNVVDSWIDEETLAQLARMSPWDMVLWPFQTMREIEVISPSQSDPATGLIPSEWVDQLKILNPLFIVPSSCQFILESWSWYNQAFFPISYAGFKKQIKVILPSTDVLQLNPSVSIKLSKNLISSDSPLNWIIPIGEQDVDYTYNPDILPPATSDIAKNFPALSEMQTEIIYTFCRTELVEKFNSLEPSDEIYFKHLCFWQLSLYNHLGHIINFNYLIKNNKIQLLEDLHQPLSWSTEVPILKVHAALTEGESLTSMYIRINDKIVDRDIRSKIKNIDITEDPLIRCLFTGGFANYQKAQLRKIFKT